eukprot:TRINITY_DN48505_c0_g1_i1.p1 TRINITY_DN48505_c0_g1~~TRINITY_DN48505_c0_g1_i1.p1  ORF type:complete len:822 (-),score=133.52 TRINITY_DN48505_c0_g1_i1:125-2281(-)
MGLWRSLAAARARQGDTDGALQDLRFASQHAETAEDRAGVAFARASILSDLGDGAGAIDAFSEALEADPRHAEAWSCRGIARLELGDTHGAEADAEALLALDSESASAWGLRGAARLAAERPGEAVQDLETACRLDPDLSWAQVSLEQARRACGSVPAATTAASRSTERDSGSDARTLSLRQRGNTSFKRGDYREAIEAYAKACATLEDGWPLALSNKAICHLKLGEYADAVKAAELCLREEDAAPKVRMTLFKALVGQHEWLRAFQVLRELKALPGLTEDTAAVVRTEEKAKRSEFRAWCEQHRQNSIALATKREKDWVRPFATSAGPTPQVNEANVGSRIWCDRPHKITDIHPLLADGRIVATACGAKHVDREIYFKLEAHRPLDLWVLYDDRYGDKLPSWLPKERVIPQAAMTTHLASTPLPFSAYQLAVGVPAGSVHSIPGNRYAAEGKHEFTCFWIVATLTQDRSDSAASASCASELPSLTELVPALPSALTLVAASGGDAPKLIDLLLDESLVNLSGSKQFLQQVANSLADGMPTSASCQRLRAVICPALECSGRDVQRESFDTMEDTKEAKSDGLEVACFVGQYEDALRSAQPDLAVLFCPSLFGTTSERWIATIRHLVKREIRTAVVGRIVEESFVQNEDLLRAVGCAISLPTTVVTPSPGVSYKPSDGTIGFHVTTFTGGIVPDGGEDANVRKRLEDDGIQFFDAEQGS